MIRFGSSVKFAANQRTPKRNSRKRKTCIICGKICHNSIESAQNHADKLNQRFAKKRKWEPYRAHNQIHVGRPSI